MLIHVGDERNGIADRYLAGALSAVAGALNAVGYLTAHSFTANMTGNVSAFADEFARGSWRTSISFLLLLALFIGGASLAAAIIAIGEQRGFRSIYALTIASEGLIVLGLGLILSASGSISNMLLISILSAVMGFQNAVTSVISNSRVRTTHISGMATDIGIGLVDLIKPSLSKKTVLSKLGLYSLTLSAFTFGGVGGVLIYGLVDTWFFALAGGCLFVVALPEILRARRLPRS
ncbi:MAG: YoaK family protein [Pseudomonadota bacterium]|nr:YoaK family protein [Pseudomonadota bacterium]